MKLNQKTVFACGHEEIKEVEVQLRPELRLVIINGLPGVVVYDQKRCYPCYQAAHS